MLSTLLDDLPRGYLLTSEDCYCGWVACADCRHISIQAGLMFVPLPNPVQALTAAFKLRLTCLSSTEHAI
jgi:hypothetical protein